MSRLLNFFTPQASPRIRARSPQVPLTDVIKQMGEQQNEIHRKRCEEDQVVNVMMEKINQLSGINISINGSDPLLIRIIIKQIILVHGLTDAAIEKIKRCRPLLSAISNAIAPDAQWLQYRAKSWLQGAPGKLKHALVFTARQTASLTGQCLVRGAQFISDRIPNVMGREPPPEGRGSHSPERRGARNRSRTPPQAALQIEPLEFVTRALSGLYDVLSGILNRAYNIIIQPCVGAACTAFTRLQRALSQGVNEAAPEAPAECAICMGTEDDSPEILGYIVGHGDPDRGHPDRFHQSCLQGCRNICPMCRAPNPLWSPDPPPAQGGVGVGGGLKKYRSRSKSKSKSKSRRYISKPRKSRKAGKRIRHYSSRRK